MCPQFKIVNNERGSIIVVALLLLVFLTILGITATNNTRMELNVTRNSQEYKRDFYVADSGWRAAAMNLQSFALSYPNYTGDFSAGEELVEGIAYTYTIEDDPDSTKAVGSSGALGCKDVTFDVWSRALNDGAATQEISARLTKLCCGSYH